MNVEAADVLGNSRDLQPDPLDRVHRLEPLRADLGAVHDRAAAEQPVGDRFSRRAAPLSRGRGCRR